MARDGERPSEIVTRRKFMIASGAAGIAGLADCAGGDTSNTTDSEGGTEPLIAHRLFTQSRVGRFEAFWSGVVIVCQRE